MSAYKPWTSRDVEFTLDNGSYDLDVVLDPLVEHYWDTWRHRVYGTLHIGSSGRTINVGGWPWWVPAGLARRGVADVMWRNGYGGDARYVVSRSVLR